MTELQAAMEYVIATLGAEAQISAIVGVNIHPFAIPIGEARPAIRVQPMSAIDDMVQDEDRRETELRLLVVASTSAKNEAEPFSTAATLGALIGLELHGLVGTHGGYRLDVHRLEEYSSHALDAKTKEPCYEYGGIYRVYVR